MVEMKWFNVLMLLLMSAGCSDSGLETQKTAVETDAPELVVQSSVIVFEPTTIDLGTVKEGEEVVVFLLVRNSGDAMAQIVDVQTSWGCSVAEPEESLLMPGGFTRIKLVIDTFAKLDDVKKWVQLTDAEGKSSKVWLSLNVQPNPHLKNASRSIFDGKCAACHFDTAKGQISGPDIYAAVCAMCHGAKAEGGYAPALKSNHDANILSELITNGTGSHHMPAFAVHKGGPLTKEQVSALSQWLSTLDE
ncbi:MAG: DUF1573 domain-containing protein [Mariprofundus sp.]